MNTGAYSTAVLRHHAPVFLRAELMCIIRRQQSGHSIIEQQEKKLINGVALHNVTSGNKMPSLLFSACSVKDPDPSASSILNADSISSAVINTPSSCAYHYCFSVVSALCHHWSRTETSTTCFPTPSSLLSLLPSSITGLTSLTVLLHLIGLDPGECSVVATHHDSVSSRWT